MIHQDARAVEAVVRFDRVGAQPPVEEIPAVESGGELDPMGGFKSPALEDTYRKHVLGQDRAVVKLAAQLSLASMGLWSWTDYQILGGDWPFPLLLGLRLSIIVALSALIVTLSRLAGWRALDRMVFAMVMLQSIFQLVVDTTRPPDFFGWVIKDVCFIVIVFCFIPLPLRLQLPPTLLVLIGDFMLGGIMPAASKGLGGPVLLGAVIAFGFGFYTSLQFNRQKRQLFLAGLQLEKAMQEIRTLRGIVPICSHCKMIRDEVGVWQAVEIYVRRNSHAEFSHGICPVCAKLHYPWMRDEDLTED